MGCTMTSDSQQAVLAVQKAQKMAKKLKKLQARLAGSTVSDEDQAALDKLQKKLKKLRQQCKDAKQAADTAVDTAPSTESEDSAVPVPAAHSEEAAGKKKSKKRDREAGEGMVGEPVWQQLIGKWSWFLHRICGSSMTAAWCLLVVGALYNMFMWRASGCL